MNQENIYRILDESKTKEQDTMRLLASQHQTSKTHKITLLKPNNFKSTGKAIVSSEYYHLISKENLASSFSQQRKDHSTFGLPVGANKPKKPFKGSGEVIRESVSVQKCPNLKDIKKNPNKPAIPSLDETPIHGLISNVNFVNYNQHFASSLRPPIKTEKVDYLKKSEYGKIPDYLDRVKQTIDKENEFIRSVKEKCTIRNEPCQEIDPVELNELKVKLGTRYEEVNKKYQCLTHITKVNTVGFKKRKERMEKEMDKIEKDLNLLQKNKILIEKN